MRMRIGGWGALLLTVTLSYLSCVLFSVSLCLFVFFFISLSLLLSSLFSVLPCPSRCSFIEGGGLQCCVSHSHPVGACVGVVVARRCPCGRAMVGTGPFHSSLVLAGCVRCTCALAPHTCSRVYDPMDKCLRFNSEVQVQ